MDFILDSVGPESSILTKGSFVCVCACVCVFSFLFFFAGGKHNKKPSVIENIRCTLTCNVKNMKRRTDSSCLGLVCVGIHACFSPSQYMATWTR